MSAPSVAVRALIDRLHAAGVELYRRGETIRYRCARGAFTESFRAEVAANKAELLLYLAPYPCHVCGRHAFPVAGVVCYWCREGRR